MKNYSAKEIKNIVLIGAPGTGKTTLAEAMAFEGKVIALPVQKGSGRSSAFRDAAAVIPNPQGRKIEAGEAVEAQMFFNGLLG